MTARFFQVESLLPFKKLTSSFKPSACSNSAAIVLLNSNENKVCMVTKRKKIDWGGQSVFPGGLTSDHADSKFVNYIQKYCHQYITKYNFLFDDIKYRLNALRELFEESGILLYRDIDELNKMNENIIYPIKTKMYSFNNDDQKIIEWREKVLNDPFQFEMLHRSMNIVPDILTMVPWVRVRTPWRTGRRWDTRFYLALINKDEIKQNVIHPLGKEIVSIDWVNIGKYDESKLKFPPPTIMKLKELNIICCKENVLENEYRDAFFTRNVTAIRPKLAVCDQRAMIVWNRDYLYHELDLEAIECNTDYEENEKNIHRIYITGKGEMKVVFSFNRMYEYNKAIVSKL